VNYLFISRHKIGYALVKFPLWTWGIYSSRTVRFNSSRLSDLLKELFLPFLMLLAGWSEIFLALDLQEI